jgi:hypothetical protein
LHFDRAQSFKVLYGDGILLGLLTMFDQISVAQIDREIVEVIGALEEKYKDNNNVWICPSNESSDSIRGSGNIVKSEAILCYLLPLSDPEKDSELAKQITDIVSLKELQKRIDAYLTGLKGPEDFTGHPYLQIIDSDSRSHAFLDSYCFIISILVMYAKVFGTPKEANKLKHYTQLFAEALNFTLRSAVKNERGKYTGFFFTDEFLPAAPYKYPTWMAIDTLSDLDTNLLASFPFASAASREAATKLLGEVLPQIEDEYIRLYVNQELSADEERLIEGRNLKLTVGLIKEDQDDNAPHYNIWAILVLLYLGYDSYSTIQSAFEKLSRFVEDETALRKQLKDSCPIYFFSDHFPAGDTDVNSLSDRSFLAQFIKGLSLFFRNHPQATGVESLRATFQKAFNELLKNRQAGTPLWDRHADKSARYAVFQTERSMEALCSCRRLLLDLEKDAREKSIAGVDTGTNWQEAILRHAIQLRIGDQEGREIIAREVKLEVERVMDAKEREFRQLIAQLQSEVGELKQGINLIQGDSSAVSQIKALARGAGFTLKS